MKKYMAHDMLSLMLNHIFKNLHLMSSFIAKQGKTIVDKHNKKTVYPMLLKCHHHLQPLFENVTIDQGVDEDYILNIFKMTRSTSESTKELVSKEPLIFKRF